MEQSGTNIELSFFQNDLLWYLHFLVFLCIFLAQHFENAILSNLAKNTGNCEVGGDRKNIILVPRATRPVVSLPRDQETSGSGDENGKNMGNSAWSRMYYQTIIIFKVRKRKVLKNKPCQGADKKDLKYFASLIFLFWQGATVFPGCSLHEVASKIGKTWFFSIVVTFSRKYWRHKKKIKEIYRYVEVFRKNKINNAFMPKIDMLYFKMVGR